MENLIAHLPGDFPMSISENESSADSYAHIYLGKRNRSLFPGFPDSFRRGRDNRAADLDRRQTRHGLLKKGLYRVFIKSQECIFKFV